MMKLTAWVGAACGALLFAGAASAQVPLTPPSPDEDQTASPAQPAGTPADEARPTQEPAATARTTESDELPVDPDNMADTLNSQQQLKQTFTLRRTINGKVTDTEQRTIVYDKNGPVRPTEAGGGPVETLLNDFAREVLTRNQAYEEAKIDFAHADVNRDGGLDAGEYVPLVMSWRDSKARSTSTTNEEAARQREFQAFVDQLAPNETEAEAQAAADRKFHMMTGGTPALSRKQYIADYLADFDAVDANRDGLLRGDELMRFRALNRGESLLSSSAPETSSPQ